MTFTGVASWTCYLYRLENLSMHRTLTTISTVMHHVSLPDNVCMQLKLENMY